MAAHLRIGFIVNPLAGLGGSVALKGSDGAAVRALAATSPVGPHSRAQARSRRALSLLQKDASLFDFVCWGGAMGGDCLAALDFEAQQSGRPGPGLSDASDTRRAAAAMLRAGVDLILFSGGDGTARDIHDAVGQRVPVLGIPVGVKMQSGVFALSPEAAGELLLDLARGGLVNLAVREVRDIDEEALRRGEVRSRFYGELRVPAAGGYLQHTKIGGREDPQLAAADIAAWLAANLSPGCTYLVGPGTTTAALMAELGLPGSLLGVDAIRDGTVLVADATEAQLLDVLRERPGPAAIVASVTGGQGYLFGRGNQQFSPAVIRAVGEDNILVIAARSKIAALAGRPVMVDTDDPELDRRLCGYRRITTGYDDHILYRVSDGSDAGQSAPSTSGAGRDNR